MSIRIPGGQSLLNDDLKSLASAKKVEVVLCGPVVATYPKEFAEEIDFGAMLATHGIYNNEESEILHFGDSRSVGYVAVVNGALASIINSERAKGKDIVITSPLEGCVKKAIVATKRSKNLYIHLDDEVAYVAYAEDMHLKFAEIIPVADEKEMVDMLALINKDFDIRKAQFTLEGRDSKRYFKCFRNYFRRVELAK